MMYQNSSIMIISYYITYLDVYYKITLNYLT